MSLAGVYIIHERDIFGKREFYFSSPCFSSQASRAANSSSLSFRSAFAARCRNRLRKAFGTLKASGSRLAVLVVSSPCLAGAGGDGGGTTCGVLCDASAIGAAAELVRA